MRLLMMLTMLLLHTAACCLLLADDNAEDDGPDRGDHDSVMMLWVLPEMVMQVCTRPNPTGHRVLIEPF